MGSGGSECRRLTTAFTVFEYPSTQADGGTMLSLPWGLFTQSQEVDNGFTEGQPYYD